MSRHRRSASPRGGAGRRTLPSPAPTGAARRLRAALRAAGAAALLAVLVSGALLWHAGYRAYVVHTGSMSPVYVPGDLVIDAPAANRVRPGEVITFRHSALATDVVTHRVVTVTRQGIHTKGDANRSVDAWTIRPGQVRGRVISRIPYGGYVAVFLQRPGGVASVATSALAIVLLWGLFFPGSGDASDRATRGPVRRARHRGISAEPA